LAHLHDVTRRFGDRCSQRGDDPFLHLRNERLALGRELLLKFCNSIVDCATEAVGAF
jgi:hypothetical protein